MKYLSAYRIATYLLVLFLVGHTAGGMLAQKSLGPAADSVFSSMKSVHFAFNGGDCTWYGFWLGFGLVTSVFLLFSAITAWTLASIEPAHWSSASVVAWALFASHVGNAVLGWTCFFPGTGILATSIAALLGVGAIRGWRHVNRGDRSSAEASQARGAAATEP